MQMHERINVLGVGVSAVNMGQVVEALEQWIRDGSKRYVCVAAAHSVMACLRDAELRRIFNSSGMTTPDGMPLVWLGRLHGYQHVSRVYGPDLVLAVCQRSIGLSLSHYFVGGGSGVAERLANRLRADYVGLDVVGFHAPPYRPLSEDEDALLIEAINRSNADIVWVGLGTGKQERWMAEHLGRVEAPVMIGVGAAFDFLSGMKRQAPRWMRRTGLEWLFRLLDEPGRLWRRYLEYPRFVILAIFQLMGLRSYTLERHE